VKQVIQRPWAVDIGGRWMLKFILNKNIKRIIIIIINKYINIKIIIII